MKRYRQWLAETEDHMTESPDGKWAFYAEALADIEAAVKEGCQIITEGIKVVENLEEQIAILTVENKRLKEREANLRVLINYILDTTGKLRDMAIEWMKGKNEGSN